MEKLIGAWYVGTLTVPTERGLCQCGDSDSARLRFIWGRADRNQSEDGDLGLW
jgi:hypothetical protein